MNSMTEQLWKDNVFDLIDYAVTARRILTRDLGSFTTDRFAHVYIMLNLPMLVQKVLEVYLLATDIVPRTCIISDLLRDSDRYNSMCYITPWLRNNAAILSDWEDRRRYDHAYNTTPDELTTTIDGVFEFMDVNGFKDTYIDGMAYDRVLELSRVTGIDLAQYSIPVRNVMYRLHPITASCRGNDILDDFMSTGIMLT